MQNPRPSAPTTVSRPLNRRELFVIAVAVVALVTWARTVGMACAEDDPPEAGPDVFGDDTHADTAQSADTGALDAGLDTDDTAPGDTTLAEDTLADTGPPPPGPAPVQRCGFAPALDLVQAACAGSDPCPVRQAWQMACDGHGLFPHLTSAPGGAALYVKTHAIPTFGVQHETFLLRDDAITPSAIYVTRDAISGGLAADLLARTDDTVELWFAGRSRSDPVERFLPDAEIDPGGYSVSHAQLPDIGVVATATRPDGVPTVFFLRDEIDGLFAMTGDGAELTEQQLTRVRSSQPRIHDLDGALWLSWLESVGGDYVLHSRALQADASDPGHSLLVYEDRPDLHGVALTPFGSGDHVLTLTAGGSLRANPPWAWEEHLSRTTVPCDKPTCDDGCEQTPLCVESRVDAYGIALQTHDEHVRAWHLSCDWEQTVGWKQGSYWDLFCLCDKCTCDRVRHDRTDDGCDLVASDIAQDVTSSGTLARTERWRLPMDLTTSQIQGVEGVVADDTLWLLVRTEESPARTLVFAVDTTHAPTAP